MPRFEVRRRIEDVVTVEAADPQAAQALAVRQPDDDWHCVWKSIDQTIELVRCAGCGCDLDRGDSDATHQVNGRLFGSWMECACCPCQCCRPTDRVADRVSVAPAEDHAPCPDA